MPDSILKEGDKVNFLPTFGMAVVMVKPGTLPGSGPATIKGKNVCVQGDETAVEVPGCLYMSSQYPIPGAGTLKIKKLAGNQLAKKTKTGGKAVLLKGSQFTAVFVVDTPATHPAGPADSPQKEYSGTGTFISTNKTIKGS